MKPEVRDILESCLAKDEPLWRQTVEDACRTHPEIARELREAFDDIVRLHRNIPKVKTPNQPQRVGEFRILHKLGEGGMGVVYLAEQETLGRKVAIKMIQPNLTWTEKLQDRFRREAEAVSRLQHPGIVPLYSVGVEEGNPYFVMEWLPGCTLSDILESLRDSKPSTLSGSDMDLAVRRRAREAGAALPQLASQAAFKGSWEKVCMRLFKQIAEALEHVHARGILHRDVKPSNIFVTPTGRAMLLDFGLALIDDAQSRVTKSGAFLGTSAYASPEQLLQGSKDLDERSDLYSLGASLYEALTFQTPTGTIRSNPRVRPSNPSVSRDLEEICRGLLAETAELRYRSAADAAKDLGNALEGLPLESRHANPWRRFWVWTKGNPGWAAAYALVLLGFAGFSAREVAARADAEALRMQAESQKTLAETKSRELEQALESLALERDAVLLREQDAREAALAARNAIGIWGPTLNRLVPRGKERPLSRTEAFKILTREAEERFGADPRSLAACHYSIGLAFGGVQEWALAESSLRKSLDLQIATLGAEHIETAATHRALASPLARQGKRDEGLIHLRNAFEIFQRQLGPNHRDTKITAQSLASF